MEWSWTLGHHKLILRQGLRPMQRGLMLDRLPDAQRFVAHMFHYQAARWAMLEALPKRYQGLMWDAPDRQQEAMVRSLAWGDMWVEEQRLEVSGFSVSAADDNQVAEAVGAPPPASRPPATALTQQNTTQPCDLDELQITEVQAGVQLQNADTPPTRTLKAIAKGGDYQNHKRDTGEFDETTFEMVAGSRKEKSRVELHWMVTSTVGYHCGEHHPTVRLTGQENQTLQGVEVQKFPVYCAERPFDSLWQQASFGPVSDVPFDWIMPFWFGPKGPKRLRIAASTCGCRPGDPKHVVARADLDILVYPRDSYSLNIQLPTYLTVTKARAFDAYDGKGKDGTRQFDSGLLGKREFSKSSSTVRNNPFGKVEGSGTGSSTATGGNGGVATTTSTKTITGDNSSLTNSRLDVNSTKQVNDQGEQRTETVDVKQLGTDMKYDFSGGRQGTFGFGTYGAPPGVTIELKRNSETPATISFGKVKAMVDSVRKILKNLNQWCSNPPASFGYSIKGEVKFLTGNVALTWGYKEMPNNLVTKFYQLTVDLTIVDATVTFFIGLNIEAWPVLKLWEVEGIKIGGEASLNGKLVLKNSVTYQSEDEDTAVSVNPQATIAVTGSLTCSAGGSRWIKGEGTITGGLKAEAKMEISFAKPLKLSARADMQQVIAVAGFFFRGRPHYIDPIQLLAPRPIIKLELQNASGSAGQGTVAAQTAVVH